MALGKRSCKAIGNCPPLLIPLCSLQAPNSTLILAMPCQPNYFPIIASPTDVQGCWLAGVIRSPLSSLTIATGFLRCFQSCHMLKAPHIIP